MTVLINFIPEDPILAIGLTTSISSFIKLICILTIGRMYESVQASFVPFTWRFNCSDGS